MEVISEMRTKYYMYLQFYNTRVCDSVIFEFASTLAIEPTTISNITDAWLKMGVNYTLFWSHSNHGRIAW